MMEHKWFWPIVWTLAVLAASYLLKVLLIKQVTSERLGTTEKRKWIIIFQNLSTLLFFIGVVVIWSEEIQAFALSLVALAAAFVIAGKEFFLCAMGGVYRASVSPFSIGDRIEIDKVRGDVVDSKFLVTKILEIGPHNMTHQYTGRLINIPNSYLLTKLVINESYLHKFVLHVFVIPLKKREDWRQAEKLVLEIAKKTVQPFISEARHHMNKVSIKEGLTPPGVAPRVTLHLASPDELDMIVRIPAPANKKGTIEQEIIRQFLVQYAPFS